jgi:hypothetical protein
MSLNLYPQSVLEPDLTPDFSSDIDDKCTEVYEACKGWGTDDSRLLKALGSTTPAQRALIPIRFEQMHEKNLKKLVDSETSGDFGTALELLSLSPDVAEAKMIKMACKGEAIFASIVYFQIQNIQSKNICKNLYTLI